MQCIYYSDVVIIIMHWHDLHSNSGAIKLNQTGGILKHLRTGSSTIDSDVRPIFIFAISNSYVLLSLLNTLGKPEKLYCTGFGQANAEIQRFEEH